LTDLDNTQPSFLNTERPNKVKTKPTSKSPQLPRTTKARLKNTMIKKGISDVEETMLTDRARLAHQSDTINQESGVNMLAEKKIVKNSTKVTMSGKISNNFSNANR
jgi:hypothetical protein